MSLFNSFPVKFVYFELYVVIPFLFGVMTWSYAAPYYFKNQRFLKRHPHSPLFFEITRAIPSQKKFPKIFQLYFCLLLVITIIYFVSLSVILLQEALHFCLGLKKKCFFFRLKEVADRINRLGHNLHPALSNLHVGVKRICLGSTCIALLLEDGRVCRLSYNILPERLDLSKNDSKR